MKTFFSCSLTLASGLMLILANSLIPPFPFKGSKLYDILTVLIVLVVTSTFFLQIVATESTESTEARRIAKNFVRFLIPGIAVIIILTALYMFFDLPKNVNSKLLNLYLALMIIFSILNAVINRKKT